ncbi:LAFE_0E10088g1_1 [Lachancea fermentati]|uniref:Nuclear pore complex protein n=1 Tax=Lachancea fermentati TaxID=4955 RepID=A0A1G4MDQ8_LACFM|nr:LAFE_0E10088g1_1 [Lachancea fermentati]
MEMEPQERHQTFASFARALQDFRIACHEGYTSEDVFGVVKDFRSISGSAALELTQSGEDEIAYENWELEAKLWHLFDLLFSYRVAEDTLEEVVVHPYSSNAVYKKELLDNDHSLYEIWLVIVWIQANLADPKRPQMLPSSKWSHSVISGGLKSCDMDYPLRDHEAVLDPKDVEEDGIFFKYVYELLLAGNFEEIRKECEHSDNLTLSMILCGAEEYIDPRTDTTVDDSLKTQEGIKKKALWRRAVYSLSLNTKLDKYERAIYSYLAGTVIDDLNIDLEWDSELLLYLNQLWQTTIENFLIKQGRVDKNELIVSIPSVPVPIQKILNIVSSKHPNQSEHPIRVLIGATILDNLSSIIKSSIEMLLDVVKGIESNNDLFTEPYLLRIVTHLAIFINIIRPETIDEVDKSKLITAYVTILSLYELYDLVPVYISFLNEEDAKEAYSFFLSNLTDAQVRHKQLELSVLLQLPIANILRRTTQRIFADTEDYYKPDLVVNMTLETTPIDRRLMLAVEWLIEGKLYVDAMDAVIALSRRFLINGRIKALESFFGQCDIETVIKNYEVDTMSSNSENSSQASLEIRQYQLLVAGFMKLDEWNSLSNNSTSTSDVSSRIKDFKDMSESTYTLIKSFLVDLTENKNSEENDTIYEIRALYTPYLVIELHKVLVHASKIFNITSFINEALLLANMVANETDRIYLLFKSSGRLQEYLQLIANTATLVAP